jgi:iron complex outermembrane recepter protein
MNKIEVVRGPASLLYGTSAVGGVVNAIDGRIPDGIPSGGVSGVTEIRGNTAAEERSTLGGVTAAVDDHWVIHADGSYRRTNDYRIPGFARSRQLRNNEPDLSIPEPKGREPFSASENNAAGVGASYVFDSGYVGVSASTYHSLYGVPAELEDVKINLDQSRYEIRGMVEKPIDRIQSITFNSALVDYDHREIAEGEVGTIFRNKGYDSRVEVRHDPIGKLEGLFGAQVQMSDFEAVGEERFQPPTLSYVYSGFIFEQYALSDALKAEAGIRLDHNDLRTSGYQASEGSDEELIKRSFTTISASSGLTYTISDPYTLALSVAYTERGLSGQELFSNGPHVATGAFEIGNPNLNTEKSIGTDLTLRKKTGRITGSFGVFANLFHDYVNLEQTAQKQDGLPVYNFISRDAIFLGYETQAYYHFLDEVDEQTKEDLALFAQSDVTWTENRDTGASLPRIPPFRLKSGLEYKLPDLLARAEVVQVFRQQRNDTLETETPGYTLLNIGATQQIVVNDLPLELFARGENLLNEKVRNNISFIKDVAPQIGMNVIGGVRVRF